MIPKEIYKLIQHINQLPDNLLTLLVRAATIELLKRTKAELLRLKDIADKD